jgi:hypothetical protein
MQCIEFETRLNDLLDERRSPSIDRILAEHADSCASCAELLASHESLLEGLQGSPKVRLSADERRMFTEKVLSAVAALPHDPFPGHDGVELVERPQMVASANHSSPLALVGMALAAAAAILIALLPWFQSGEQPANPNQPPSEFAGADSPSGGVVPPMVIPWTDDAELAPIAWVGFQVADGLKPVTSSMVSALRELRKRPFFRNEESGRSSFYTPPNEREVLA